MSIGSFARGSLAELTEADLGRMLDLNETLFVEHKKDLGDKAYQLAKAVAAFANTLGGWLLVGVQDGRPYGGQATWVSDAAPTLVDAVRDRLRTELDPLPPFEARVIRLSDGPVGVVRIYESSDTPHVVLSSGSIFVREVAGDSDAATPKRRGAGASGDRTYRAVQIRSRSQLLELTRRGEVAAQRTRALVDPWRPLPLMNTALGLGFEQVDTYAMQPLYRPHASIFVRLAPYTLSPRFRAWSTTAGASAAAITAAEQLAIRAGLGNDWSRPHPAGCWVEVPLEGHARHHDRAKRDLPAKACAVVDGSGIVGVALHLGLPDPQNFKATIGLKALADELLTPAIRSALVMLEQGEFLGRALCQVDVVRLAQVVDLEQSRAGFAAWVPTSSDLTLPADDEEISAVAALVANALGRSAGLQAWDPPPAVH